MKASENGRRVLYWDNMKGFLIILVVFAHFLYQFQSGRFLADALVDFIYLFHMPAFIFVSGYFGKSKNSRSPKSIAKLLILYYLFNTAMGFLFGFESLLIPVYSYWYLLALAVWRVTAPYLAKINHVQILLVPAAILVGLLQDVDNTLAISRIIAFYPFYMAGYLSDPDKNKDLIQTEYKIRAQQGAAGLLLGCICAFLSFGFFNHYDDALVMFPYTDVMELFERTLIFATAFFMIYAIRYLCPAGRISGVTVLGQNCIWIYILHRPVTLWVSDFLIASPTWLLLAVSIFGTAIICVVFGSNFVAGKLNYVINTGLDGFCDGKPARRNPVALACLVVSLIFVQLAVTQFYSGIKSGDFNQWASEHFGSQIAEQNGEPLPQVMSTDRQSDFDNAFRITFAGDLILLEDQVKLGWSEAGYNFDSVFEYAGDYIKSADYAIGVFEGPMAGEEAGYSSSNYDDGKELWLNFPDEFAVAVKSTGFDLVTTATNHVLDRGLNGAVRTLDILDETDLDHTGSYRNQTEKENNRVKFVEKDGLTMAILSYTYGSNDYELERLIDGDLSYVTSVISGSSGKTFNALKSQVEQDFELAKSMNPDLIIVLPHIGMQFENSPDEEQRAWFQIFKDLGADIILGDHPHAVQPVEIVEYNGRMVFEAYCPGNFANIYREYGGDASMLIDIYISRETKKIIGGAIVPLYTQARADGNYRALPVYEVMRNQKLREQLSSDDINRTEIANRVITSAALGVELDASGVTERYYFDNTGYLRSPVTGLEFTPAMRDGVLYQALAGHDSICFIGDSVTEGTKNAGCPWYEPITEYLDNAVICNYSKGGCTVSYMTEHAGEIPDAEIYVIALGTNDVRYRDSRQCAMTAEAYVEELGQLKTALAGKSPGAQFVFIAPWYSVDGDPYCPLSFSEKTELNEQYTNVLRNWCMVQNVAFVNPNPQIRYALDRNPDSKYLLDHIHPNAWDGVLLYSEAALLS